MIRSHFIKNSVTIWLKTFLITIYLELVYFRKSLKLGYRTNITNCKFGRNNTIFDFVVLSNSQIGDFTYISNSSNICNTVIGKFCSIGSNVKCGLPSHPSSVFVSTHPIFYSTLKQSQITFADKSYFVEEGKIVVGNDVWIGSNVIIMSGLTIGDGAIIASGSIVTKDIPAYSIYGGVPAKIIRYRFEKDEIDFLLNLKWWDFEIDFLRKNFDKFHNIKTLMSQHHILTGSEI
jgi:acetyltransferase-like isoleucine patch superfamily enzyme